MPEPDRQFTDVLIRTYLAGGQRTRAAITKTRTNEQQLIYTPERKTRAGTEGGGRGLCGGKAENLPISN